MPLTSVLDKTRTDLERALSDLDKTPLYAVVGVGDLAVAKLRNARGEIDVQSVPGRAQGLLGDAIVSAFSAYGDLAGRGKSLVTRVRRQQATSDLQEQATSTVARAKATKTTLKKQAGATKQSAAATASTARKSAAATTSTAKKSASRAKSSAKATTTSAKKTASATKKATSAAANKTGR
ncbi:MAG: hypothetical protein WKF76_08160 [Nocardioidaceae bacterium]